MQVGTGKGGRDFWALNYFCCLQRDLRERAWWACYYWRIYFCEGPHWAYKRPYSLSRRIFCQSKCLKFFFSEPPRAVSCRHGNYILPFLPCHFSVPMPWKTSVSHAYLHPLSGFLCLNFFFLPQFCAQDCVFCSNIYSAFPSLFNIFGNLQSMIWIAGCIN